MKTTPAMTAWHVLGRVIARSSAAPTGDVTVYPGSVAEADAITAGLAEVTTEYWRGEGPLNIPYRTTAGRLGPWLNVTVVIDLPDDFPIPAGGEPGGGGGAS